MSLATRCSHCSTVFRIVQDQLKVSEGWVRCGRCNEVFNALDGLMDLDRDKPPPPILPEAPHERTSAMRRDDGTGSDDASTGSVDPMLAGTADLEGAADIEADKSITSSAPVPVAEPESAASEPLLRRPDDVELSEAEVDALLAAPEPATARSASIVDSGVSTMSADSQPVDVSESVPAFLQSTERTGSSRSRRHRGIEVAAAVLLALGLGLQGLNHFRDLIAASVPAARPVLTAWCAIAACTIELPRRIEDVAVESTTLTRMDATNAYTLSVVLHNRGTLPLAVPSIDLSLTDANGQLVARRMLAPGVFRIEAPLLKPGASTPLQVVLASGGERISGYTVEAFYP